MSLLAVDLFAGTGWGVACAALGIDEVGVELMPEARATREANGMRNWLSDVWEVLEHAPIDSPEFNASLLIASPPCQTFSMAGSGAGRRALDEVIGLIDSRSYFDVAKLREFGERHDMRTALVLTPLTYAAHYCPTYIVLEQVPTVLPVWERIAVELRGWGYSVVTGILNAEQYGVPQTRKRAILIARADDVEARMPTPTHSRYYPRDKTKLDDGVAPWVSMAEALGWGMTARPSATVVTGANGDGSDPMSSGSGDGFVFISNDKLPHSARRASDEPAPTMTAGHDSGNRIWEERPATTLGADDRVAGPGRSEFVKGGVSRQDRAGTTRVTVAEAAALQSYPADFDWSSMVLNPKTGKLAPLSKTKAFLQIGNAVPPKLAEAILATILTK